MPHYAVLASLFLKVTDCKKLRKGEVTCSACLSSTRGYSSFHDGLVSGGSPVISLSPNNCIQHLSTFSHKILRKTVFNLIAKVLQSSIILNLISLCKVWVLRVVFMKSFCSQGEMGSTKDFIAVTFLFFFLDHSILLDNPLAITNRAP